MADKRSNQKRRIISDRRKGGTSSYNGPEKRGVRYRRSDDDRRKKGQKIENSIKIGKTPWKYLAHLLKLVFSSICYNVNVVGFCDNLHRRISPQL